MKIKEIEIIDRGEGIQIEGLYPCFRDTKTKFLARHLKGKVLHPVISPLGELRAKLHRNGSVTFDVWDTKRKKWMKGDWNYCERGALKKAPLAYNLLKKRKKITFYLEEA